MPLALDFREVNAVDPIVHDRSRGVDNLLRSMCDLRNNRVDGTMEDSMENNNGTGEQRIE